MSYDISNASYRPSNYSSGDYSNHYSPVNTNSYNTANHYNTSNDYPSNSNYNATNDNSCSNRSSCSHSNKNKKLVDEIEDVFLLCSLCSQQFVRPKILSCLHTFCTRCLEEIHEKEITQRKYYDPREVSCPLCRKKTQVPAGGIRSLPDNHLVLSLSDVVSKQKEEMRKQLEEPLTCEVCKEEEDEDDDDEEEEGDEKSLVAENDGESSEKTESGSNEKDLITNKESTSKTPKNANNNNNTSNNNAGKRRKSFMTAGLVLRTSFYDEETKENDVSIDQDPVNGTSARCNGFNNNFSSSSESCSGSSSGVSSNSSSCRNTRSSREKETCNNNNNNINNNVNNNNNINNVHNSSIKKKPTNSKNANKKDRRAISKCLECNKVLCAGCVQRHQSMKVTGCHCLIDVETEKDVQCKEHPGEAVRFFCEECLECVCVLCAFNKHREHNVETFSESAHRQRETLAAAIATCRDKNSKLEKTIKSMKVLEGNFKRVEAEVREKATEAVMEIRAQERELITQVHDQLGPAFIEYLENKEHLDLQLETMQNTCNLADMIAEAKDVEMLLLKKEVEDKLTILSNVTFQHDLPVPSIFTFVPGSVHLGSLERDG